MNEKLNDEQSKALIRAMRTLRDDHVAARRRPGEEMDAPSAEKLAQARGTLLRMTGLQVVATLIANSEWTINHLTPRL